MVVYFEITTRVNAMKKNGIKAKGVVRWLNRSGQLFGYIESQCGKEVYFDKSSLKVKDPWEISIGDSVQFLIVKNDFGEIASGVCALSRGASAEK